MKTATEANEDERNKIFELKLYFTQALPFMIEKHPFISQ